MVYESDFYTTRRYRTSPSVSSYTSSTVPSRQVRILPGLGKVHIVHSYDRIVPYVGHKRLTVVTVPPTVYSTRPSILRREYDWIESKVRPRIGYSATNRYLNSDSAVRISYASYPITGLNYYSTYYNSPSLLSTYYNWPRDNYYYPYHRYLRNYLNLWPMYKSVDNTFSKLEYDIDNLRRMIYLREPLISTRSYDYTYYPETTKPYRPLTLYYNYNWPLRSLNYYTWPTYGYWPSYRSWRYSYPLSDTYWYSKSIFDDETRLIRAQTASLLKRIQSPVPRLQKCYPITSYRYEGALPSRLSNDNYICKMLQSSPVNPKVEYATYWSEPTRKYIGQGHLSCVSYAGERAYPRRRNVWIYEDPVKSDIQLLSYYIQKFRQEKSQPSAQIREAPLNPARPSRRFPGSKPEKQSSQTSQELKDLQNARAARLAKIYDDEVPAQKSASSNVDEALAAKKKQEEARALAEEQAKRESEAKAQKEAEAKALKEAEAKKAEKAARKEAEKAAEEAAQKAEKARQEELAAQAAAERAAELERQAEQAREDELVKQAEIEKAKQEEEERLRLEEQKRLNDEAKAEEERQQLLRLEELAREAEEEKESELVRQAEELAELARQEAELNEEAKKEAELDELARQQAELQDIARQEAELDELHRTEQVLLERARVEAEAASRARIEADAAQLEAKLAVLAQQEAELAELERQQAELDALDAEEQEAEAEAESEPAPEDTAEPEPEDETQPEEPEPADEEADEAAEEEEDPHAIAEDAPETVASDAEVEEAEEEEEEEE